jgi:DUF971 family protein
MTLEQNTPNNIEVDIKQSQVRISWADGYKSSYSFNQLRKICPCAGCEQLRANDDPLRILKPEQVVTEATLQPDNPVEMVGHYALQFSWGDGHSAGIYTFKFLRQVSG